MTSKKYYNPLVLDSYFNKPSIMPNKPKYYTTKLKYSLELFNKSKQLESGPLEKHQSMAVEKKSGPSYTLNEIEPAEIEKALTNGIMESVNENLNNLETKGRFFNPNRDYSDIVS